jgi:hypothetical protein
MARTFALIVFNHLMRRWNIMTVQIIINGETAAESLKELSALAAGIGANTEIGQTAQPTPVSLQVPPQQSVQTYPSWQGAPTAPQQPVVPTAPVVQAPPAQVPTAVPTASAPTYTMEQLGVAAGPIIDAGRAGELTAWINQRGAASLSQLDPSHYGDFAQLLRSLGAKL